MDEITTKLRQRVTHTDEDGVCYSGDKLLTAAADEIERLQKCISIFDATIRRSGLDISRCGGCEKPTLTIPGGQAAWCVDCEAAKAIGGE